MSIIEPYLRFFVFHEDLSSFSWHSYLSTKKLKTAVYKLKLPNYHLHKYRINKRQIEKYDTNIDICYVRLLLSNLYKTLIIKKEKQNPYGRRRNNHLEESRNE